MEGKKHSTIAKKVALVFLLGFAVLTNSFSRDIEERNVEQMDSWQEEFDITAKKGKYNVVVSVTDLGGNSTQEGPFNIYIDPKSDLPICQITNPVNMMRVPGNLNIVGTCIDDDAVDYVEIIFDGDKENPVRAVGKDFWSYFLKTEGLTEGIHTIEVYGVDINGLKGNSVKMKWCLDRQKPVIDVTNLGSGTIVSGNVSISGTVSDGNGIRSMWYSLDNGETFEEVKVSNNPKTNSANFKFSIDTKKLEDGPAVIWFKAADMMGSIGNFSFLCFVDNTNPALEIVHPADKVIQNGVFTAAGSVKDAIGIKSLTWEFNGESGEFEIVPGNAYWSKEFNFEKGVKSGPLTITAIDTAGNVTKKVRNIVIDSEADKPVVTLAWPESGAMLKDGEFFVRGIASDDDSVQSVTISVDGQEIGTIETSGTFATDFSLFDAGKYANFGKHTISVVARDIYGTVGNPVKVEYQSAGTKPVFAEPTFVGGKDAGYAYFGKVVNPEGGSAFAIEAASLSGIKSATYTISWTDEKFAQAQDSKKETNSIELKNPVNKLPFSIPVETLPWGLVQLNFEVTDVYDRVSSYSTCLYVSNFTKVLEPASKDLVEQIENERATIKIADVAGSAYKRGMNVVVLSQNKSVNARWNKDKDLSAKIAPVGITLDVDSTEKDLQLSYKIYSSAELRNRIAKEGKLTISKADKNSTTGTVFIPLDGLNPAMTTVEVTAISGKDFSEKMYAQVAVVRDISSEYLNDAKIGQWVATYDTPYNKDIGGFVIGSCGKLSGFVNLDGDISANFVGRYPDLEILVDGKTITILPMDSGIYRNVVVRATDSNGNRVDFAPVTIVSDREGPSFKITRPVDFEWERNRLIIQGTASDRVGIASVEYSIDGGSSWKSFGNANRQTSMQLYAEENIQNRGDGLIEVDFRGVDISGNVSYYRTAVQKDTTPPSVQVVVPVSGDTVNGKNVIAFLVKDDGKFVKAEYVNPKTGARTPIELSSMINTFVGTPEQPIDNLMRFEFTDAAGNVAVVNSWDFKIDSQQDLPIATVQLPTDNEVITKDFVISGVVLDDDGPSTVYYRIDNGAWNKIEEPGYSFSVNVPLSSMTDNEHSVTVYGVDINGVRGPEFVRKFRVSLAEPASEMTLPKIETTQSKIAVLRGTAFDKNGIKSVEVSVDNGNSFNEVVGKENWSYTFDTRALPDGTHVVFVRTTDNYGIESMYSSLINIDNTSPEIQLELPLDESRTTGPVFFSGYTIDNIGLKDLFITITSIDGKTVAKDLSRINLTPDKIITKSVDISSLDNGNYNIRLTGSDAAGNQTSVSRNIVLDKRVAEADVNIYYPLNGEHKSGDFNIYGEVVTTRNVRNVSLIVDGKVLETAELSKTGYFKFRMNPEVLANGNHSYKVRASLDGNMSVESIEQTVVYSSEGPWITIDNFGYGDFAVERPFIKGQAGYSISQEEIDAAKAKGATKEQKEALAAKTLSYIEVSFNNGRTFERINSGAKAWKYRVENEDMPEGYHFLFVRAVMKNGEVAINRCIIQIDKTAPFVKMIAPSIGGKYNQTLEFSGLANDAVGLNSVTLSLRKGDKAGYEIPSFIQGLYLDGSFWGSTLFNVGMGLTFFDNNVKLQFQWGQFTQAQREIFTDTQNRYGGNVFGMKLLANIASIPFRSMFGPDWDWLSAGIAIGANFSVFTETASGKPQILSALLAQLEFPRITFKKAKCFRTISLYSEFQVWFIPTDVVSTELSIQSTVFQFSEGIRINIF